MNNCGQPVHLNPRPRVRALAPTAFFLWASAVELGAFMTIHKAEPLVAALAVAARALAQNSFSRTFRSRTFR
jgi:hypothetical protein